MILFTAVEVWHDKLPEDDIVYYTYRNYSCSMSSKTWWLNVGNTNLYSTKKEGPVLYTDSCEQPKDAMVSCVSANIRH